MGNDWRRRPGPFSDYRFRRRGLQLPQKPAGRALSVVGKIGRGETHLNEICHMQYEILHMAYPALPTRHINCPPINWCPETFSPMIRRVMEEVEAEKAKRTKKTEVLSYLLFLPFLLPPGFHHLEAYL